MPKPPAPRQSDAPTISVTTPETDDADVSWSEGELSPDELPVSEDPHPSPFERPTAVPPMGADGYVSLVEHSAPPAEPPTKPMRTITRAFGSPVTAPAPDPGAPSSETRRAAAGTKGGAKQALEPGASTVPTARPPGLAIEPQSPTDALGLAEANRGVPAETAAPNPSPPRGLPIDARAMANALRGHTLSLPADLSPPREETPDPFEPARPAGPQFALPEGPTSARRRSLPPSPSFGTASGNALELVAVRAISSIPPSPDPTIEKVRDRFDLGDFSGALVLAEAILQKDPENADVMLLAEHCRDVLKKMYISRLGGLEQRPSVVMSPEQLRWLSLDHRSGFVLSLVDGHSKVDEVLDVSGMPDLDALRILFDLLQQNVIRID
jgi:hypothetical protein